MSSCCHESFAFDVPVESMRMLLNAEVGHSQSAAGPAAGHRLSATIAHSAVAGRVRLRHPGFVGRDDRLTAAQVMLDGEPGILSVRASALTGSVLVNYRHPLTLKRVVRVLDAAACDHRLRRRAPRDVRYSLSAAAAVHTLPESIRNWHGLRIGDTLERLGSHADQGLAAKAVAERLAEYGANELQRAKPRSAVAILAEQMTSLPIALLGASAGLSILTGGLADAAIIGAVVLMNAGIATATERQAEKTILGMANYTPKPVLAIRNGRRGLVAPATLVPGDLIVLERGTLVPADARLLQCNELTINESVLTGEALPVHKDADVLLRDDAALAERTNMAFRGTAVTGGSGFAVVTSTGMNTEIGRIQRLLGTVAPPETPIQRQLGDVGRELIIVNGVICGVVFGLGLLRGQGLVPMLRSAISLGVAAIPEGLPAVATTTLALGIQDMRQRQVFVRKLDAVETLGAVEVIALDKTGTLTENRMAARAVHVGGERVDFASGVSISALHGTDIGLGDVVRRLFEVASLCSDAIVRPTAQGHLIDGTPTEAALLEGAIGLGIEVAALRLSARVLSTVGRGDGRKRMSTLHATETGRLLCVKGDPAEVLARCTMRMTPNGDVALDEAVRAAIVGANEAMAAQALRVLGVADAQSCEDPGNEQGLRWIGLVGLANPIRPSVEPSLRRMHHAGIRTVMITGDQSATAFAIARQLNLGNSEELKVLEAGQISGVPHDLLAALVGKPQVFARVSPVDKLNIVKALQADGHIVAMTGDGINDGPALRAADIGIAMGGEGTDVAREVADIVLAGDDLDGIVEAVRLGRATYANIRKVLRYLVSTNASETFTMLGAALLSRGEPLTPMQLLWLNLMSDPLPALALGLEEPDPDVLDQAPHDPRNPILMPADFRHILREGAVMGSITLAGYFMNGGAANPARAGSVAFHGITIAQLLHAIVSRTESGGLRAGLVRPPNRKLYGALAASAAMQLVAQFFPPARRLLGLAPLGLRELTAILGIGVGSTLLNEILGEWLRDVETSGWQRQRVQS
jgi:Ca2+-transporting ATPase